MQIIESLFEGDLKSIKDDKLLQKIKVTSMCY
jgi:hypothetical protein